MVTPLHRQPGDGQNAQLAWIGSDAAAEADQDVSGSAVNDTIALQTAEGEDGNYAQSAGSDNSAAAFVGGVQGNAAGNVDTVVQAAAGDQNDQSAAVSGSASGNADQDVEGTSSNATLIAQEETGGSGNFDQAAWSANDAATLAAATQGNAAGNVNTVIQGAGGAEAQNSQDAWIGASAAADADQDLIASSSNDAILSQTATETGDDHDKGGSNVAQSADNDSAAVTIAAAGQLNGATNVDTVVQAAAGEQNGQWADIESNADADAAQDVAADSSNATAVVQTAESDASNVGQDAWAGSDALTVAGALQGNAAANVNNGYAGCCW